MNLVTRLVFITRCQLYWANRRHFQLMDVTQRYMTYPSSSMSRFCALLPILTPPVASIIF